MTETIYYTMFAVFGIVGISAVLIDCLTHDLEG